MKHILHNLFHLLRRHKVAVLLNTLGFAAAFAVMLVIMMQVGYDMGFNMHIPHHRDVFVIASGDRGGFIEGEQLDNITANVPEIKDHCILGLWERRLDLRDEEGNAVDFRFMNPAGPNFVDFFQPRIVAGNADRVFSEPGRTMISQQTAGMLFGDSDPVGRVLYDHESGEPVVIDAVYRDFPRNSVLSNSMYGMLPERENWRASIYTFFRFDRRDKSIVEEKINDPALLTGIVRRWLSEDPANQIRFYMLPVADFYPQSLFSNLTRRARAESSSYLMLIGLLAILMAFINYVNFSVALGPSRVRAINIRKILGAGKRGLRRSIAMEGVFIAFVSYIIAVAAVYFFSRSQMARFFMTDFSFTQYGAVIAGTGIFVLIMTFVAGLYPAFYSTSFDVGVSLKGSFALSRSGVKLRNVFVCIQFIVAIALISFSVFVKVQHDYMVDYSWGLQKENVAYLPAGDLRVTWEEFGREISADPAVLGYSASMVLPGFPQRYSDCSVAGKKLGWVNNWSVAANFPEFIGVRLVEGDGLSENYAQDEVIVNETFVREVDSEEPLLGTEITIWGHTARIVGIAGDFNFEAVREPISPLVIYNWDRDMDYIFIRLAEGDRRETIDFIGEVWKRHNDEPFDPAFLDERLEGLYRDENNLARLVGIFGIITIMIAVMGIYGLIMFNARSRIKEIGIRKVNGATAGEIMLLLNRNLLVILLVAAVIAVPITFYAIVRWVNSFAYAAPVPWWLLPASILIVLAVSLLAVSRQSWRAAGMNPVDSIKTE